MGAGDFGSGECAEPDVSPDGRVREPDFARAAAAVIIAGIDAYLDLYYAGRTKLPPDETNGNTPLVSAFEVAWYSWKETKDPRLPDMIAAGEVKNMIDLCYQTLALADIDAAKYKDQIAKNAERILSLQRRGRTMVDAIRPEGAGSGISNRARAVGARRGRRPPR